MMQGINVDSSNNWPKRIFDNIVIVNYDRNVWGLGHLSTIHTNFLYLSSIVLTNQFYHLKYAKKQYRIWNLYAMCNQRYDYVHIDDIVSLDVSTLFYLWCFVGSCDLFTIIYKI